MTEGTTTDAPTCYRHPSRETYIRCARCDRPICPDCMRDASVGFQCPECVAEGRRSQRSVQGAYGGRLASGATLTVALIVVNVIIYAITAASGANLVGGGGRSALYDRFALYPPAVAIDGQYYRFVTSMFLHYSIPHILFNMVALYYVGVPLERVLGRWRFLVVYFAAGIGGSVASYAFGPLNQLAAGASGAIFGLFAAFFIITRRSGRDTGGILGLIAINFVLGFVIPNVDILGHVGGLIAGGLVAAAIAYAPRGRWRSGVQAAGVAAVLAVLAVLTVVRTHALTGGQYDQPTVGPGAASVVLPNAVRSAYAEVQQPPRA